MMDSKDITQIIVTILTVTGTVIGPILTVWYSNRNSKKPNKKLNENRDQVSRRYSIIALWLSVTFAIVGSFVFIRNEVFNQGVSPNGQKPFIFEASGNNWDNSVGLISNDKKTNWLIHPDDNGKLMILKKGKGEDFAFFLNPEDGMKTKAITTNEIKIYKDIVIPGEDVVVWRIFDVEKNKGEHELYFENQISKKRFKLKLEEVLEEK